MKVVPAILEEDFQEIKKKVDLIKPYLDLIQLDVMDGEFVPNKTYNSTEGLDDLGIKIEVHLMINHPELNVSKWFIPCVETIIVHQEAVDNMDEVIRLVKDAGKKIGLAINPGTSTYDIEECLSKLDMVLVMGVSPGFSGQSFNSDVLEKITHLKKMRPDLPVEVDGGVNFETKNILAKAGVDILAANSVLFNEPENIKDNINKLSN